MIKCTAALGCLLFLLVSCSPQDIELEWNPSWRTDIPYELSFNAEKLGSSDWVAVADGKELGTALIQEGGREAILRFSVPEGTSRMELRRGKPVRATTELLIDSPVPATALVPFPVTGIDGGCPARFELDVENISSEVQGVKISVLQYDNEGNRLPEELTDGRWLTHLQPARIPVSFRQKAWIHPSAASVQVTVDAEFPDSVIISRLAVVPAARYPFPGFDLSHFCEGVSGGEGDYGVRLGESSFWYQTRSQASWAGGYQMRDPKTFFFPVGEGTVEAWMKPDWSKAGQDAVPLFEASHHASTAISRGTRVAYGRQLCLTYCVPLRTATLTMRDADGKDWSGSVEVDMPSGEWSHVAVSFRPGDAAALFVGGRKVLDLPLKGFKTVDIATVKFPNDCHAMEFYLGASYVKARGFTENDRKWQNIRDWCDTEFHGEADLLRVSDCVRYCADFVPQTSFTPDCATKALFDFNESVDGINVGGCGIVTGVLKASSDLYSHTLNTDRGSLQYYPAEIAPDNDIDKVLRSINYPDVPDESDFRASDCLHTASKSVLSGESFTVRAEGDEVFMDCVEIENAGDKVIECPLVLRRGDVDFRSFADIAATLPDKSPNTLFNYAISASDYFMTHQIGFAPHSDIPFEAKDKSLAMLGSYCGFECGPLNKMLTQMYAFSAGIPSNYLSGYGHEFQQIFFDGKNHVYDLSGQRFYSDMNNETSAGLADMEDQPGIFSRYGVSCAHFIKMGTRYYDATLPDCPPRFGYRLRPGEKISLWWSNAGQVNDLQILTRSDWRVVKTDYSDVSHSAGDKPVYRIDRFFPEYGNAVLEFDGKPSGNNPAFCECGPDSFCYLVESCYPIVAASYEALDSAGQPVRLEISTDSLRSFRPFTSPASYAVRARTGYFIKVCAPLTSVSEFRARTILHTNTRVQTGRLHPGKNVLDFKADNEAEARITFRYRTRGKDIYFPDAVTFGSIRGCEQSLVLLDPSLGEMTVPVEGLSPRAVVESVLVESGCPVNAVLSEDALHLSSADQSPRFAWVTLKDGDAEKTLTVLVCPGARLVAGYSSLLPGESCRFDFEGLPAGKYAVLCMDRFPGGIAAQRKRIVNLVAEGYDIPACSGVNEACGYYKAPFGQKGGRGNWKWDFPYSEDCSYPYDDLRILDLPELSSLEYFCPAGDSAAGNIGDDSAASSRDSGSAVEIGAVLIVPEPSRDFKCSIFKCLCSVNSRPWAFGVL